MLSMFKNKKVMFSLLIVLAVITAAASYFLLRQNKLDIFIDGLDSVAKLEHFLEKNQGKTVSLNVTVCSKRISTCPIIDMDEKSLSADFGEACSDDVLTKHGSVSFYFDRWSNTDAIFWGWDKNAQCGTSEDYGTYNITGDFVVPEQAGFAMGWVAWLLQPVSKGITNTADLAQNSPEPIIEPAPAAKIEPNFSVKTYTISEWFGPTQVTLPYVEITAKDDVIEIYNVSVNRGNCVLKQSGKHAAAKYPQQLKFGNVLALYTNVGCRIIEVAVASNNGEWTITFE